MTHPSTIDEITCTQEDFVIFRDYIHEKSGIFFADNKLYLVQHRLVRRLQELQMKSIRDYFYHVKYDNTQREFQQLMNLVTTNETSFFRNEPQLQSFASEAMPLLMDARLRKNEPKTLKLWSAGCSTGEEPYTLAIMMLEAFRSRPGWSGEIIANDISEDVLARARIDEYSGTTLRNIPPELLARYFVKTSEGLRVCQEVRSLVKFSHLNLNDPRKLSLFSGMDSIFCRNVMIYFSDDVKKELVRGFYNALRSGGYFYIGHSESLHGVSKSFKLVYFKNALVYQRDAATELSPTTVASPTINRSAIPTISRSEIGSPSGGATRARELLNAVKRKTTEVALTGSR